MNINIEQIEKLKLYISNVDELVVTNDLQEVLLAIDDKMLDYLDQYGNLIENNEDGIELMKLYDEIYSQNKGQSFFSGD